MAVRDIWYVRATPYRPQGRGRGMAVPGLFELQRIGHYGKSIQEAVDSAQRSAASMEAVDGTVSAIWVRARLLLGSSCAFMWLMNQHQITRLKGNRWTRYQQVQFQPGDLVLVYQPNNAPR